MSNQFAILEQTEKFQFFEKNGYLKTNQLIPLEELGWYMNVYDQFISGEIDAGDQRSDLSGSEGTKELITQIMRPSLLYPQLTDSNLYHRVLSIARMLMGEDMDIDFDMLINKAPHTNKITPWHQDAAYWIEMPDKRAVSCWVSLDGATLDNGCMWYVPGSHLEPLREHEQTGKGGALQCQCTEAEGIAVPLMAGEAALHQGGTLHYSRGNSTDSNRKAIIINCRPSVMIAYEREQGFDHLGGRTIRNEAKK